MLINISGTVKRLKLPKYPVSYSLFFISFEKPHKIFLRTLRARRQAIWDSLCVWKESAEISELRSIIMILD